MSLYAVTINGRMLYLMGHIPDKKYILVEEIARSFSNEMRNPKDADTILQAFVEAVRISLDVHLRKVPIDYVFRIN